MSTEYPNQNFLWEQSGIKVGKPVMPCQMSNFCVAALTHYRGLMASITL